MRGSTRREKVVAGVLIGCLAVVGVWEVMANRSRRPFDAFHVTAADLKGFVPELAGWSVVELPVGASPAEPNVLALEVRRVSADDVPQIPVRQGSGPAHAGEDAAVEPMPRGPVLVRLAHGYNMPDCMRIKGYEVAEVGDQAAVGSGQWAVISYQWSVISDREAIIGGPRDVAGQGGVVQVWRLTSDAGDVSVWATSMLRTADFAVTGIDVRTMAFPRIGMPDDPGWLPRGITLKSFRHPVRNFRWLIRAKWNNSRRDLATFLKLKRPAWADDTVMTLVSAWKGPPLKPGQDAAATAYVLDAHGSVLGELQRRRGAAVGTHQGRIL